MGSLTPLQQSFVGGTGIFRYYYIIRKLLPALTSWKRYLQYLNLHSISQIRNFVSTRPQACFLLPEAVFNDLGVPSFALKLVPTPRLE